MEYRVDQDLKVLREYLLLTNEELAEEIGIPFETFSRIINQRIDPSSEILEKIYSFIYKKEIKLNELKVKAYEKRHRLIFVHGSKNEINGPLSLDYSRDNVDMGKGFYAGDNYHQAVDFVCHVPKSSVYVLDVSFEKLSILKLDVSLDWMLSIAYYRGMLEKFKNTEKYRQISDKLSGYDVIIAPIADIRMFTTINDFLDGMITSEQAVHAINALHLGDQIVFKTEKALRNVKLLERLYLCNDERKVSQKEKINLIHETEHHVFEQYQKYLRQGEYVTEVFKQ